VDDLKAQLQQAEHTHAGFVMIGIDAVGRPSHFGINAGIHTSTLDKAPDSPLSGYSARLQQVTDLLLQRTRPYLFLNSLPTVEESAARLVHTMAVNLRAYVSRVIARCFYIDVFEVGYVALKAGFNGKVALDWVDNVKVSKG